MKKTTLLLILIVAFVLTLTGCDMLFPKDPREQIVGTWYYINDEGVSITYEFEFQSQGVLVRRNYPTAAPESYVVGGNFIYRIDEDALSLYEFSGYNMYTSKPMVVYDYTFEKDGKKLTMKPRDVGFEDYVLIKR